MHPGNRQNSEALAGDPRRIRRTKIVATIGPASRSAERLTELLEGGVNVCRLNFSHGALDEHEEVVRTVRAWSQASGRPVAVLGDLCGPKIRLNAVRGGEARIETGASVRIVPGDGACDAETLTTTHPTLVEEVQVGQRIYIDDGAVRLIVVDKRVGELACVCKVGGVVSTRKGVNLPDTRLAAPALTAKDRVDLAWACRHELEYVALSFVRRPADVRELRDILRSQARPPQAIVKIEKVEALENLDELVELADGVMVARGDMGVEVDAWNVPLIQKSITARCRAVGKPVIIATQMLASMVSSPTPTRAEVSDVANAILDGVDAIMLSAETASGEFPLGAVEVMRQAALATEAYDESYRSTTADDAAAAGQRVDPPQSGRLDAIAHAAADAAVRMKARLVAAWTTTGETVRHLARQRMALPIVGLAHDESVFRRLSLLYGVYPLRVEEMDSPAQMMHVLDSTLRDRRLVCAGDTIVVVTSTRPQSRGETDTLVIRRIE